MSDFENYITDQFIMRDTWTTVKAAAELALGKQVNNNVYLCADDTLIKAMEEPDKARVTANINAIKTLASASEIPVYFELIPGASSVWSRRRG